MDSTVLFESIIYRQEIPEYLEKVNGICDEYVMEARKESKKEIREKEKKYGVAVGDHGMSYHSHGKIYQDERLHEFELLVRSTAKNVLESQGFDLSGHQLDYTEMWVQQFADKVAVTKRRMCIGTITSLVFIS